MVDLLSEDQKVEQENLKSNVLYEVKTVLKNGQLVKIHSWKPKCKAVTTDHDRYEDDY